MSPTSAEILAKARESIGKGDVAAARAALAEKGSDEDAVTASADKPIEPALPRTQEEVLLDLVTGIHRLLGNSPALTPLVNEFHDLVKPSTTEEPNK